MKFRIPRGEFEKIFSRSSGPGGQSVNKLNSKATIKLDELQWKSASWVPEPARAKLTNGEFKYVTKSGAIIVQSDRTRSQATNLDDCFSKLEQAFQEAAWKPAESSQEAQARWENLNKKEKKKMSDVKRRTKEKKASRKWTE